MTGDWWGDIEGDVLDCLARHGAMPPAEIGRRLGFSETTAVSLVTMLASEGRVRIGQVELSGPAASAVMPVRRRAA